MFIEHTSTFIECPYIENVNPAIVHIYFVALLKKRGERNERVGPNSFPPRLPLYPITHTSVGTYPNNVEHYTLLTYSKWLITL